MLKTTTCAAVVLVMLLAVPAAWGQSKGNDKAAKVKKTKNTADAAVGRAADYYQGVTLHGGDPPEFKPPPVGIKYVTWPGFQVTPAGSEIFLQISGPVIPVRKDRGRKIFITLDKTRVPFKNNLRSVITKHFNTPVSRFRLRKLRGDKLRLEIKLRYKTTARHLTRSKGQYTYLIVSFPPYDKKKARVWKKKPKKTL